MCKSVVYSMNVYKGKEERLKINELSILFKSWKEKPNERENIKDERTKTFFSFCLKNK